MIKSTLGGKKINIPTSWKDVTIGQLVAMDKNEKHLKNDPVMLISCLTTDTDEPGHPEDKRSTYGLWFRTSMDQINRIVIPALKFSKKAHDFTKLPHSKTIKIGRKEFSIPEDLSMSSYGQMQVVMNELEKKGHIGAMPFAIAAYLQPQLNAGEFDHDKARAWCKEIFQLPVEVAYPVAAFFLTSCIKLKRSFDENVTKNSPEKKSKRTRAS